VSQVQKMPTKRKAFFAQIGMTLLIITSGKTTSQANQVGTTNSQTSSITNVWLTPSQIPTSVFDDAPGAGVDPFYPNSTRRGTIAKEPKTTTPVQRPRLVLSGISFAGGKRVATINNRAFTEGEEMEVDAGSTRVRIKCEHIGDDYVIITYGTPPQQMELRIQRY